MSYVYSQQPPLAPGAYAAQQPMAPQVRSWSNHAALTHPPSMVTNGYAVAVLTGLVSFFVMGVLNPTWAQESDRGQGRSYRFKWPFIYGLGIVFAMVIMQRVANLRPGVGWMNMHTLTAGVVVTVVLTLSLLNRGGGGFTGVSYFSAHGMREGVKRADEFARKADGNPNHFEAVQEAALASGHLYAFATLAGGYEKLSKSTGIDTEKLRDYIESLRQSYYSPM